MFIDESQLELIRGNDPVQRPEDSLLRAAVAIILRDGEHGTEFLMMQRAFHERDPWSGQMSFPGGKIDPEDENALAAAVREVQEEVGINLNDRDYVGQLDDLYGLKVDGIFSVHVACFVFKPHDEVVATGNYEVADTVWLSLAYLNDPANTHDYYHPKAESAKMPAVMIDAEKNQILWGLSLRMLSIFHELIDWPMQVLSEQDQEDLKSIEKRNIDRSKLDDITQKILDRGK